MSVARPVLRRRVLPSVALLVGLVLLVGVVGEPVAAAQASEPSASVPGAPASETPAEPGVSEPAYVGAPYFAPGQRYTENFPDPAILFDPATNLYYAYATTTGGVQVPVMTSPDAVTWTARGNHHLRNPNGQYHDGLPDASPPDWPWSSSDPRWPDDLWAPGVTKLGHRWAMFYALRKNDQGRRCIVYATSDGPAGPFVDPKELVCSSSDPMGSIDPEPFTDPATGTTYLVWKDEGLPGTHGQRIWAQPITLTNATTVAFTGNRTFLLESAPGWEQYVAESPTLTRIPGGQLLLLYSGNQWGSADYATGVATCSGFGPSGGPVCTRTSIYPYMNRRAGRMGIGAPSLTRGRDGQILVATHSWDERLPAGYDTSSPSNQRRMTVENLHVVGGRLVLNGEPGPTGPPPRAAYVPRAPARVLDTRSAGVGTTMARRLEAHEVMVLDLEGITSPSTTAVTMNVTVADPVGHGFVTVFPCGEVPNASNVNFAPNQAIPDLVTVQVNARRRVCLYADSPTNLVVDLQGTYETTSSGGFAGVTPARLVDTRVGGTMVGAGRFIEVQVTGEAAGGGVPVGATAAALNLTATDAPRWGWLTAWGCAGTRPNVSNVNYSAIAPSPNAAIVPLSASGTVCVYAESAAHVVVDVFGYTGPSGPRFEARAPTRVLDTRLAGGPVGAEGVVAVDVVGPGKAPEGSTSVVLTLTATGPQGYGWLSVFPCSTAGSPGEQTSNLNVSPGETRAAHVTVPVDPDGRVCVYSRVPSHVLVDLAGSFA